MREYWKDLVEYLWEVLSPVYVKSKAFWVYTGRIMQWCYTAGDRWVASIRQILASLYIIRSPYKKRTTLPEDWQPLDEAGSHEVRLSQREYRVYAYFREYDELGLWNWMYPLMSRENYMILPWQSVPLSSTISNFIKPFHLPLFFSFIRLYPSEEFLKRLTKFWGYNLWILYARYAVRQEQLPNYALGNTYDPTNPPDYGINDKVLSSNTSSLKTLYYLGDYNAWWIPRYDGNNWKTWFEIREVLCLLESVLNDQFLDPVSLIPALSDILRAILPPYLTIYIYPLLSTRENVSFSSGIRILQDNTVILQQGW